MDNLHLGEDLQSFKFHQEQQHYNFLDFSFEYLLEEALFFSAEHPCGGAATPQSMSFQDELDALFEGDILSFWDAMEEEARHKSEQEPKLRRDATDKATKMQRRRRSGAEEDRPLLTFEMVSQHFCVPIKQAAQELKVGLTHLKKRCRELGIRRWPQRKVKSLQTLIKNVQELGMDTGEAGDRNTKIVVEMLQQKTKLIQENPGEFVLDDDTMVLRQACFKEQFKRRRLMASDG